MFQLADGETEMTYLACEVHRDSQHRAEQNLFLTGT